MYKGENEIVISIAAPPRDGLANDEMLNFFTNLFGIKKSEIIIDQGEFLKEKILLITTDSLSYAQIKDKLRKRKHV